jgi:alkaline phosphatase D
LRQSSTLALTENFGKIELLGEGKERFCRLNLFDKTGALLWSRDVFLSELQ